MSLIVIFSNTNTFNYTIKMRMLAFVEDNKRVDLEKEHSCVDESNTQKQKQKNI